jgi:hypothetical protein
MKSTLLKRQQLEEEKNAISLVGMYRRELLCFTRSLIVAKADPEVRVSTRMLRSKRKDASQPEKIKGGITTAGGVLKKISGAYSGVSVL